MHHGCAWRLGFRGEVKEDRWRAFRAQKERTRADHNDNGNPAGSSSNYLLQYRWLEGDRGGCTPGLIQCAHFDHEKAIIAGHGRARLGTTHKANELLTRAGVIANHAEQAAGGQRGSEHVHTA